MSKTPNVKIAPRRWRQRLCRILVVLGMLCAVAYISLPWWVPTDIIRRHLAEQMSEQLGLEVSIGELTMSWDQGVELKDFRIASPEGFSAGSGDTMVSAASIRAELSPINLFWRRRISWMEVDQAVLNVEIDDEGNVNASVLERLKFDAQTDTTSIRNAVVNVVLPAHKHRLVIGVQDMQVIAGRTKSMGRITMSAELRQNESTAPVALSLDKARDGSPVSATAFFNFADVDMAQLNLIRILNLPLRKLAGRCSGSLNLQANADGKIDRGRLVLTTRELDLQPLDAGIKLPVIAEAGFRVTASYDPVAEQVELRPFSVKLPGLDLAGSGTLFTDALAGNWRGISHLEMNGEIRPAQLVAMLTGTNKLPAELGVSGPLRLEVKIDRNDKQKILAFTGTVDGSAAEITHAERTVKPFKRKLRAELKSTLDERTFGLDVSNWRIWLGENLFTGRGTVRDVRKLLADKQGDTPLAPWEVLANWQWNGRAELRDLDSLRSLGPPVARALEGVKLSGPVMGDLSVDSREGLVAQGSFELPEGTELSRGDLILKGADHAVRLAARASANHKSAGLDDVEIRLTIGNGRVVLDRGTVRFVDADPRTKTGAQADIAGDFEVAGAEHIIKAMQPGWVSGLKARGSMSGKYVVRLSPEAHRLHLTLSDTSELEFRAGDLFAKAMGAQASGSVDFLSDHEISSGLRNILRCSWRASQADLRSQISFASDHGAQAAVSFYADIRDATWLATSLPKVAAALGPARLSGAMRLEARADWSPGTLKGEISCNADALGYESNAPSGRRKPAGQPLQFRLAGKLSVDAADRVSAGLEEMTLLLGKSYARIAGRVDLAARMPKVVSLETWPQVIRGGQLTIGGRLSADKTLAGAVPALGQRIKELGLGGHAELAASLKISDKGLALDMRIDGDKAHLSGHSEFAKPVGLPASVSVRLKAPADLSKFTIGDLRARVGDLHVLAAGSAAWVRTGGSSRIEPEKMHVTLWTRRADTLAKVMSRLKAYKLTGDAVVEAELVGRRAPYVSFHSDSLSGVWRGKKVSISGDLLARDIAGDKNGQWMIQGLRIKKMQLRAGKNHTWLLADMRSLGTAPKGTVTVLGRYIDTQDLTQWLGGPKATTRPAPVVAVKTDPSKKTDPHAETKKLAKALIASALPMIRAANVKSSVKIAHLRLWDPLISQYYDLRDLNLKASAIGGLIETQYACGLNGGSVRGGVKVNLKDDPPAGKIAKADVWQDVRDVAARENIQPQLALFFPGNTVYGQFNRRQDVKIPLVDLVANTLDADVPVYPVGAAKTVTVDGMTQGRAAPKFVTALFPGLNMTSYRYLKMTAFSDLHADGGAYSDMIFNGKMYDMYIEGTTGPDKIGRYQIGLILLGTPQTPEWNHIWRQGRLPILKFKARIEGGKMHDVSVSYPWPNEALGEILLKNNILYRAYLASQTK
jgi:hypothetical protein